MRADRRHDQVFEDAARGLAGPAKPSRLAGPHVDEPALAKGPDERAAGRVDRTETAAGVEQQPPIGPIGALPVGETALGRLLGRGPSRRPGLGVERDDDALRARDVHHAVDNDGIEGQPHGLAGDWIEPGSLEPAHVGPVDFGERGILHRVGGAAVVAPGRVRRRRRAGRRTLAGGEDRKQRNRSQRGHPPESGSRRPGHCASSARSRGSASSLL